jgi:hypothetical protein
MTMVARFLPQYPKRVDVTDGLTKTEANGVLTLGFDYVASEFGVELQQAVDSANAAAETATEAAAVADTVVPAFNTVTDAAATSIPASKKALTVAGNTAVGEGKSGYIRVASEPTNDAKFRSQDRYVPDGSTDSVNGGWWQIDAKIVDPLAMPAIISPDDTAKFASALLYAEKVTLDPSHTYTIQNVLEVTRPVIVDLNKAIVSAASGFTDDNLFKILSSDVSFVGGGTISGANLPDRTGDFIGADFKSFTVLALGTEGAPLERLKFENTRILSGDTACVAAKYCPGLSVGNVLLDGSYTNPTYLTEGLAHIQNCDRTQVSRLAMTAIRHKGLGFYGSKGFIAENITAQTTAAGEAAVFCASACEHYTFADVYVVGGFGAKADGSNYGTFRNINVRGNGNAVGGVIIQGCVQTVLQGGQITGFTQYGVAVSSHPTNNLISQDCGVYDMRIYGSGTYLDNSAGVYISADATYTNTGTTVRGNFIRTVDKGVLSEGPSGKIDNIDVDGNRFYDVKSFAFYGPTLSLDFCWNKIEDSVSLVAGVQTWTNGAGERLKVCGNEAYHMGTAAKFLYVYGNAGAGYWVSYNQVEFSGNMGSEGSRALDISTLTNSDHIHSLIANANTWFGGSDADSFKFDNANTTDHVQVSACANILLSSSKTKQNINFVQTAGSGAFNGVVENNMATVLNKPNNV